MFTLRRSNALKDTESLRWTVWNATRSQTRRYKTSYNEPIEAWVENLRASGLMLPGEFGQKQLQREVNLAAAVAENSIHLTRHTKSSSFELEIGGTSIGAELTLRDGQYVAPRTGELRARQRLEAWINHLALCATGHNEPSLLIYRKGSGQNRRVVTESIMPVEKPQAKAELDRLLKLYYLGQTTPLKFLPEASKIFAEKGQVEEVIRQFGSDQPGSESLDPYFNRAFNFPEDFDEEFGRIAGQIWEPLLITSGASNGVTREGTSAHQFLNGRLLIEASAGTGKTYTISSLYLRLHWAVILH